MKNYKTLETTVRSILSNELNETIRKQDNKWIIYSKDGSKKLGTYDSEDEAKKRLRQIEYFKHMDEQKKEKDETEYGYEGDMAISQLKTIVRNSEMLLSMLKPETDLPEWVQSKITLATDYIQTAEAYLTSEMNEETVKEEHLKEEVENEICETADAGLAAKAEKSGVSIGTLRTVYKRGVAAWNSGHRPGTTPQQWGMARVNSYITKGKGTYHGADKDLREEELVNEAVPKDKESGLPKKYVAGLSTSTAKARAAHWDKMDKKSDSDPSAYEPAPGDATAKTKPSKHTLKYNKMFGETVSEAPKTPLQRLRDFDTKRMALSKLFKDGKKPIFDKPGAVDKKTNDNK